MNKLRTNAVLLWTVLIVGLIFTGACSDSNPTIPDPSAVQDAVMDPIPDNPDLYNLNLCFYALRLQGGGVSYVEHPDGVALIGAFDVRTGQPLTVPIRFTIEESDGTINTMIAYERVYWDVENYPITVTAHVPGYIAKTIYETSSNVICIPMEPLQNLKFPAAIIGFTFNNGYFGGSGETGNPWRVIAHSTHANQDWQDSYGGEYTTPSTMVYANPNQNVGAMAFLYDVPLEAITPDDEGSKLPATLIGCSYANIGSLAAGAIGGWVMNLTEEGEGEYLGTGNYTFAYNPVLATSKSLGTLSYYPGATKDLSRELIPYYPETELIIDYEGGTDGTYELSAFGAPTFVDRDILYTEMVYFNGANETKFVAWDPEGAAPDLNFGVPATVDEALISGLNPAGSIDFDIAWTDATPGDTDGYQIVQLVSETFGVLWEIYVKMDIRDINVNFKVGISGNDIGQVLCETPSIQTKRVESTGLDFDEFNFHDNWINSTSWLTTAPFECELNLLEPD